MGEGEQGERGLGTEGRRRRRPGRGLCHCGAGIWQCDQCPDAGFFLRGCFGGSLSDSPLWGLKASGMGDVLPADGWVSVFSGVFIGLCC